MVVPGTRFEVLLAVSFQRGVDVQQQGIKAQLSELHEEQEQISSTMSEILDAQAADSDQVPFDMLDEQGLEDIIFISREKG